MTPEEEGTLLDMLVRCTDAVETLAKVADRFVKIDSREKELAEEQARWEVGEV
jgi:hypothetical protein